MHKAAYRFAKMSIGRDALPIVSGAGRTSGAVEQLCVADPLTVYTAVRHARD
jgi:hypothetical protein